MGDGKSEAEASRLVQALQRVKDTGKKSLIRSTDHQVRLVDAGGGSESALVEEVDEEGEAGEKHHGDQAVSQQPRGKGRTITLTSWKTQEFAYRKTSKIGYGEEDELPTLARGLFTCSDEHGGHRIVVRGYDKFFNEGEMPWTRPDAIAAYSVPPFELSFKENGCIIFIAALSKHQLIVTSKHSLGANEAHAISHAQKGEEWLERHLESVGKTKRELAEQLWNQDETAVAELCDDSFEEHVLAYPPDRTGLHLHGLNANTAQFQTRSMNEVEAFARQWGFLPTRFLTLASIGEVNSFTGAVAETGRWDGTAIEGFVVRTRMPTSQDEERSVSAAIAPPYADGQTWFYKVKFDEPYLMYRDWRELTRKMLSEKQAFEKAQSSSGQAQRPDVPQVRKKRAETRLFVQWCYDRIHGSEDGQVKAQPELFERLHHNQGIIQLRESFIRYLKSPQGQQKLNQGERRSTAGQDGSDLPFSKTLVVPVAIPGCGKTALALAWSRLFNGMGHTQSDDVQTKKTGPTFLKNIAKELDEHDIVFADRNNHLCKHREEIVKCAREWESMGKERQQKIKKGKGGEEEKKEAKGSGDQRRVRLVALVWPLDDKPLNAVHHLCSDRLVERGENHQSLRVESGQEHEQVLWQFLQTRQAFGGQEREEGRGDEAFDHVITLDIHSTLEESVQASARELSLVLNLAPPSLAQVQEAVEWARRYRVNVRKEAKAVTATVRYYGLSVELDLPNGLYALIADSPEATSALDRLVRANRVISRPHVTLVHGSEVKSETEEVAKVAQARWNFYSLLCQESKTAVEFDMQIDCIAWDDRAMSLGISNVTNSRHGQTFAELQGKDWRPHVTVGTFHQDIRPFEGKRVLCEADAGATNVSSIHFPHALHLKGRLRGLS